MEISTQAEWLPQVFFLLMGVALWLYVTLDGYDLGVGILMGRATPAEKDILIASIGPFWDANETWLVFAAAILLVAFPLAQGVILTALYLPIFFTLIGLILRGVAFDFRTKAPPQYKSLWDKVFIAGSTLTGLSQGYMLGSYSIGFEHGIHALILGGIMGGFLVVGYAFIGATWLIIKTEGELQKKSIGWTKQFLHWAILGLVLVVLTLSWMSHPFSAQFTSPYIWGLLPVPIGALTLVLGLETILKKLAAGYTRYLWIPFVGAVGMFFLIFYGFSYTFYPYLVPDKITLWEAAASSESLRIILIGVVCLLPIIIAYTLFAHRVFWGKVKELTY
ncbi:MAG: cytochrome d ubiquinol oxidase subunit II [Gammaproteobacteria bacterium]|nr:cytochrome d ubiquinol oxidase subunit II [Gammaproteobacteria bacterium]